MDPVKEYKEQTVYVLFYFFTVFCLLNTIFGVLSGSKCLFVSGIFALFGVLISVVTLLRIGRSYPGHRKMLHFNPEKLELIVLLGASAIMALCTAALFFVIGHMAFFDTLYPPGLLAAWVALITALASLGFMLWVKYGIDDLPEIDMHEVSFILDAYFLLSVMTMVTVVLARAGGVLVDYACAIFAAFFLTLYSVKFIGASFRGLMDGSCDKDTVGAVEKIMRKVRADVVLKELRVNKRGHILQIIAIIVLEGGMPMREAAVTVQQIKAGFRKKFLTPHEIFVGITEQR